MSDVPFKVRWLGDRIPGDWRIVEPRRIFKLRREPERPGDIHLTPSQKYGVIPQEEYMRITGARVVQNLSGTQMQHVEPGDFISHLRTFQGGLELVTQPGKVSPAYTVLKPTESVFPAYFKHVFKSDGYISQIASVTDQLRDGQSMRYKEFNLTWLPLPPYAEQIKIARQIDYELAKIDGLITDQRFLLKLIEEKLEHERDRLLEEAGGQEVRLSRVLLGLKDGTHGTHKRIDTGGEILLSAKNISSGELIISNHESRISVEEARAITSTGFPQKGDILMILVGATYGRSALYCLEHPLPFQRSVGFIRPNPRHISSEYLLQLVRSSSFQTQLKRIANVSAQPGIYLGNISSIPIKIPPHEIQQNTLNKIKNLENFYLDAKNNLHKMQILLEEKSESIINQFGVNYEKNNQD